MSDLDELIGDFEEFKEISAAAEKELKGTIGEYKEKVSCVTKTIRDAIKEQEKNGFGSSYGYGYGMSSGPRGGQRQRMVGYRSPSRRAPRARGTTVKRRRSPMMY